MKKTYCDVCDLETDEGPFELTETTVIYGTRRLRIMLTVGMDDTGSPSPRFKMGTDVCRKCALKALAQATGLREA